MFLTLTLHSEYAGNSSKIVKCKSRHLIWGGPLGPPPPQVKCRLLISSIFDAMNFQHFWKVLEIHCIKNELDHNASFISSNQTLLCVVFPTFCLADDWLSIKLFWQPGAEPTSQAWIDKRCRNDDDAPTDDWNLFWNHQCLPSDVVVPLHQVVANNIWNWIHGKKGKRVPN